jgi:hypothetical protein
MAPGVDQACGGLDVSNEAEDGESEKQVSRQALSNEQVTPETV